MSLAPRTRELFLLVLASVTAALAFASVYAARAEVVDARSLLTGLGFLLLFVIAHAAVRVWAPHADPYLLPAVALLAGIGLAIIYRLDPDRATRQAFWLLVAVALFVALLAFLPSHRRLERYRYVIGAAGFAALLLTAGPLGSTINGAKLWIRVGSFQVQPGEFAKLAIVIFLAAYLRENREVLRRGFNLRHAGPLLLFWGASLLMLVVMRDFGTSLLFYGTFVVMVWVAIGRLGYLLAGVVLFVAGSALVYSAVGHVRARFDIWLDPWVDQQGAGFQLIQGLFALADGGLGGRGLGQAYLVREDGSTVIPDAETDFIFAVVGNELGMIGAVGVLLIYAAIAWRGFHIASLCTNGFSKLLAFGLTATFALQVVIIVGGVVRLLPLTGQTLPFMSYGGSSVLANFLLIALLLSISSSMSAQRSRVAGGAGQELGA